MKINKIKNSISNNFINSLAQLAAGYLEPSSFELLIASISSGIEKLYFDANSEANFLRIISNRMDKTLFLQDLIKYPNFLEIALNVSAYSNYLTDILVRNPEYFYLVSNPSELNKELTLQQLSEEVRLTTANYNTFKGKVNAIKSIKRKEILKIGLKDIVLKKDMLEITAELSVLAKALAAALFETCYNETLKKYGIKRIARKYCLVGLGKLGGNELNYSSDIDLILFYDKNSTHKGKEYHEILTETIQLFIEKASLATESGFLYRIDFRLRPDGRNSPLCKTLQDYLIYYETRGEDWERQMLIKADFVHGDTELYNKFSKYLAPFIYPSYFKSSPLEQIRKMKINIEKRVKDKEDIKLSKGGIRDIEFSLQALQLLNGSKFPDVKTGNSLIAIEKLSARGLLSEEEACTFSESYVFFRKIEHYLQLLNDAQDHTIPQEGSKLESLSVFMGFHTISDFRRKLDSLKTAVSKIYNSITNDEDSTDIEEEPLAGVKNLVNRDKALKNLHFLREGKGLFDQKTFDSKAIESFRNIEPVLTGYLEGSTEPDLVLQNFCLVIKPESFPSIWYKQLEDKRFFEAFLKVLEYSHKSVDLLVTNRTCKESFITRQIFHNFYDIKYNEVAPAYLSFLLSVHFTLGLIGVREIFYAFKVFFDCKLKQETDKYLKKYKSDFFVAALGSFGAGEMSFASDVDLIFVSTDKMDNLKTQKLFEGLLKHLQQECRPFEIDCRLKPEGQNSPVVWNLENYTTYLEKRAKIWEFQALSKVRFVTGSNDLFSQFKRSIPPLLKKYDKDHIRNEVLNMRRMLYPKYSASSDIFNIKKSPGGIADLEFTLQYLILINPGLFTIYAGAGFEFILNDLQNHNISLPEKDLMLANFIFLKNFELSLQNIYNTSQLSIADENFGYRKLARFLNFEEQSKLISTLEKIKKENQEIFDKYLKQV